MCTNNKQIGSVGRCHAVFLAMAFDQKKFNCHGFANTSHALLFKDNIYYSDVFFNADDSHIRTLL